MTKTDAYHNARAWAQDTALEMREEIIESYCTATNDEWLGLETMFLERSHEEADNASIWTADNWELVAATRICDYDAVSEAEDCAGRCFDSLDAEITAIAYWIRVNLLCERIEDLFPSRAA